MGKLFYNSFHEGKRMVVVYDSKHGVRPIPSTMFPNQAIIYAGSLIVNELFKKLEDAIKAWGEFSLTPVLLPNGDYICPMEYFHADRYAAENVLKPYNPAVCREFWPGEH